MSEMVERAVREVQKGAVTGATNPQVFILSEASAREIVRVVITTMREPTEAMIVEGNSNLPPYSSGDEDGRAIKDAWQAMIDEALQ